MMRFFGGFFSFSYDSSPTATADKGVESGVCRHVHSLCPGMAFGGGCFSSRFHDVVAVVQSCPTICNPVDYSTPDPLSFTISPSLLRLMSTESMIPSCGSSNSTLEGSSILSATSSSLCLQGTSTHPPQISLCPSLKCSLSMP